MHKNSFAIGIPTINQWPQLKEYLEKYVLLFPETHFYIVDNGNQGISFKHNNVHVIRMATPKSVAASWNYICERSFETRSHALILNDDILLNKNYQQITWLIHRYEKTDFLISMKGFCSFILPKNTFRTIGGFDENFKGAYFEDSDYSRRLMLGNKDVVRSPILDPEIFNESASVKANPSLNKSFEANRDYYIKKWGGTLNGETFKTPFNQ